MLLLPLPPLPWPYPRLNAAQLVRRSPMQVTPAAMLTHLAR